MFAQPAAAFRDRDCSDFKTHAQAQRFFEKHNPRRDPHNLDGDNDGIACEDLKPVGSADREPRLSKRRCTVTGVKSRKLTGN